MLAEQRKLEDKIKNGKLADLESETEEDEEEADYEPQTKKRKTLTKKVCSLN